MQYTKHAVRRMQERGLLPYQKYIDDIIKKCEHILNEESIVLRVGNIAVVAAKDEEPKVITVWNVAEKE